jgi:hypothetical protein
VSVLSAGNAVIGRADALGGFPKFRVALEISGTVFDAPAFRQLGSGYPIGEASPQIVPMTSTDYFQVSANGALGLFGGFDLGVVRIGALDALVGLNMLPSTTAGGFTVSSGQKFFFSWGGRLGVIQEGKAMPAVGVTYIVRDLPTTNLIASDVLDNTVAVSNMKLNTSAWTATIGKHFGIVSLVAGGGQTTFDASGLLMWSVNGINPTVSPAITATSVQTDYFGDFGVELGSSIHLLVEYGMSSGGTYKTYNTFDPAAGASHSFLSVALAIGK